MRAQQQVVEPQAGVAGPPLETTADGVATAPAIWHAKHGISLERGQTLIDRLRHGERQAPPREV